MDIGHVLEDRGVLREQISTGTPAAEARWFNARVFGRSRPRVSSLRFPLTEAIVDAARAGMGVAVLSEWIAGSYRDGGDLLVKRLAVVRSSARGAWPSARRWRPRPCAWWLPSRDRRRGSRRRAEPHNRARTRTNLLLRSTVVSTSNDSSSPISSSSALVRLAETKKYTVRILWRLSSSR